MKALPALLLIVVALLHASVRSAFAAESSPLFAVGVARTDITPDRPIRLTGYASRKTPSQPPGLKLWAKVIAIGSDSDGPTLLVTVDNCGVCTNVTDVVAARLQRKTGIPRERIAVCSSHTHTGPHLVGFAPNIFVADPAPEEQAMIEGYTRQLTDRIESAALAALKDRRPARLAWGQGRAGFAANRRTKGGPVDHSLPVLTARDPDGRLRAVVANYACHCTTLGGDFNQTCGDWAGFAGEELEQAHAGAVALVTIGCGADSNPSPRGGADFGLALSRQHGRTLATETEAVLAGPMQPLDRLPRCSSRRIELPFQPHFTREQWTERAQKPGIVGYHARKYLARLDRGETLPPFLPYRIQTWQFGDRLAMVFLPGEVVVDYALRLKDELDGRRLWITAYANDVPCYIPSKRILQEGGYEAEDSLWYYDRPQRLAPESEDRIVRAVHELLPKSFAADPRRAEFPPPRSTGEALASFRTNPGLEVQIVAAEPFIVDPVAIDWDAAGRLWVAEMRDYPMGMDGRWKPGGRVKVLEDLDGDGRYEGNDRATVFLDDLPFPTGLMAWNGGILVCAAPDILFAEDTDGDGRADKVRKLFSGFFTDNYQARVNSLHPGLDGWIYGANGLLGGVIRGVAGGREVNIRGQDFRFKPDTAEFEPASGLTQQGRVRDDFDHWFGCDNSTLLVHYPLPDSAVRRNPHVPAPAPSVYVPRGPDPNQLYPISRTLTRFNDLHTANRTTSACGLGLYRDEQLGAEYRGNAFVCEPVHNLVHRRVLTPDDITFQGHRASSETTSEFLASTDNWFRPVQVRTGPDGALWVVDMYRFLIEHPRWIPADRLAQIDQRAGDDKGRIYRVVRKGTAPRPTRNLTPLSAPDLAAALDSPNGTERDRIQLELARRERTWDLETRRQTVSRLTDITRSSLHPAARVQALALLAQWNELASVDPDLFLHHTHPAVQAFGYRTFAPRRPDRIPAANSPRLAALGAPARFELALALGDSSDPAAGDVLARLLIDGSTNRWMRAALLSSATPHSGRLLAAAIALPESLQRQELIKQLIATAAANPRQREAALAAILPPPDQMPAPWQFDGLTALLAAVEREKGDRAAYASAVAELGERHPGLATTFDHARRLLRNAGGTNQPPPAAAFALIGRHPQAGPAEVRQLVEWLERDLEPPLRTAALEALRQIGSPETPKLLLHHWSACPPARRQEILSLLLSRDSWAEDLLVAVESSTLSASELPLAERQRLLQIPNNSLREKARRLFGQTTSGNREELVRRYLAAMPGTGHASRGAAVFATACASCHAMRGQGHEVGPNLAALRDKDPAYWLKNILDPNAVIEPRFMAYQIETRDGRSLAGIVRSETSSSLTLLQASGVRDEILRQDIASLRASGLSLMPEGLEEAIPPAAMADLIAYVRTVPGQFGTATTELAAAAKERFKADGANGLMYLFQASEKLPYPAWLGRHLLALCRSTDGRAVLKWQTRPVPMDLPASGTHAFRIPAAMGFASQPAGPFTLKVNDRPQLAFDVTLEDGEWRSADGRVRMRYTVMENNSEDSNGILTLEISSALLQPGQSATMEVVGSASNSQRWFGIYQL